MLRGYDRTLGWALDHPRLILAILLATVVPNVYLYIDRSQGLLPAAGHRPHQRRHPGRPEHLVPADAAEAAAVRRHHPDGIRRSRPSSASPAAAQTNGGFVFMSLKPLERAQDLGRPGDPAAARPARPGAGRDAVPAGGPGHPGRRPRRAMRSTSTRCRPTPSTSSTPGRRRSWPRCRRCRSSPTSTPTSRTTGSRSTSRSTATPRRGSASRSPRSTTRSTTRSASARSRPSTTRATSITWSWRWRRSTGRTRRRSRTSMSAPPAARSAGAQATNAVAGTVSGSRPSADLEAPRPSAAPMPRAISRSIRSATPARGPPRPARR